MQQGVVVLFVVIHAFPVGGHGCVGQRMGDPTKLLQL